MNENIVNIKFVNLDLKLKQRYIGFIRSRFLYSVIHATTATVMPNIPFILKTAGGIKQMYFQEMKDRSSNVVKTDKKKRLEVLYIYL